MNKLLLAQHERCGSDAFKNCAKQKKAAPTIAWCRAAERRLAPHCYISVKHTNLQPALVVTGSTDGRFAVMREAEPIYTVGHSTRSIPQLVQLLHCGCVELVIDVRTVPRSRRNPQYNEDVLGAELESHEIGYLRMADLGGLRGRSANVPEDVNGLWKNRSFHNYADYALSEKFSAALDQLLRISLAKRSAIMCAEAVWWRCHRRIIADYLIAAGRIVCHLMGECRIDRAELTPGAKIEESKITYPGDAPVLRG